MGYAISHYRSSLLDGVFEVREKETGGPAFPGEPYVASSSLTKQQGMTLRDWFAGQALAGLARDTSGDVTFQSLKQAAEEAYFYADAMLAERSK